jgi:hypothetical protein
MKATLIVPRSSLIFGFFIQKVKKILVISILIQWFKCYGTLHARGNTKKEAITKPQKVTKFLEPSDSSDSYVFR